MARKPVKRYPPIPPQFDAPSGVITVELSDTLENAPNETTMGQYDYLTRVISLRKSMPRRQQWYTLYHEMTHLWLHESGLSNALPDDAEEAICDAVATGMMRYQQSA